MLYGEDVRRLIEGNHDLPAAADPTGITEAVPLQGAVAYTRDRYAAAHSKLQGAAQAVVHEGHEGRAARLEQLKAEEAADEDYAYVRHRVEGALLRPARENKPTADERKARQDTFQTLCGLSPTDFKRQTPARKVVVLNTLIDAVGRRPLADQLGDEAAATGARLTPVATELARCNTQVEKEQRDLQGAVKKLEERRGEFDQTQIAHLGQLEVALRDGGRLEELGQYALARQPAYRARRSAGQSIKSEPGIEAVTTALGTTPDAIETPEG